MRDAFLDASHGTGEAVWRCAGSELFLALFGLFEHVVEHLAHRRHLVLGIRQRPFLHISLAGGILAHQQGGQWVRHFELDKQPDNAAHSQKQHYQQRCTLPEQRS